jgi:hypothetical protein
VSCWYSLVIAAFIVQRLKGFRDEYRYWANGFLAFWLYNRKWLARKLTQSYQQNRTVILREAQYDSTGKLWVIPRNHKKVWVAWVWRKDGLEWSNYSKLNSVLMFLTRRRFRRRTDYLSYSTLRTGWRSVRTLQAGDRFVRLLQAVSYSKRRWLYYWDIRTSTSMTQLVNCESSHAITIALEGSGHAVTKIQLTRSWSPDEKEVVVCRVAHNV